MRRARLVGLVCTAGLLAASAPAAAQVPQWSSTFSGAVNGPPAAIGAADRVAVATDTRVQLVSPANGALIASTVLPSPINGAPAFVQTDVGASTSTMAFVTSFDGVLFGVNGLTDSVVWTRNVDPRCPKGPIPTPPTPPTAVLRRFRGVPFQTTFPPGTDLVVVGTAPPCDTKAGGAVAAFNAQSGTPVWSVATEGRIFPPIAVDAFAAPQGDDRLYVVGLTSSGSILQALSTVNGKTLWSKRIDATTQGPVVFNGRVYVFTNAGKLRSFDAATGSQQWVLALPDPAPFVRAFVAHANQDRVYLAAVDANGRLVVARDAGDHGEHAWTYDYQASGRPMALGIADIDPLPSANPGPYLWVSAFDGRIDQFALEHIEFPSNDPVKSCQKRTYEGGQIVATRQMVGTAGVNGTPALARLYLTAPPDVTVKLLGIASSSGTLTLRQIATPWECDTTMVGTARLTPRRQRVARGRRLGLELSWTHPRGWRELAYLQLRLRRGKRIAAWTVLDGGRRTLRLWSGRRGHFSAAGRPGRHALRTGGGAVLDLARSAQGDDGRGGRVLRYRVSLRLTSRVPRGRYVVEALAADTSGQIQDFAPIGSVTVTR